MELTFSLPLSSRLRKGGNGEIVTKYLLKQSIADRFDNGFLNRPKMGFGIPVEEWLKGPLREAVLDDLTDWTSIMYDWIYFDKVSEILDEFFVKQTRQYGAAHVWILWMFKLWVDEIHNDQPPVH